MALATAVVITFALNPFFGGLIGRPLNLLFSLPAVYWGSFAVLFLTGTFLSGIYPALVLSRYLPVNVLKGSLKNVAGGKWLRKSLIVGQFAASIILIAGTMIVYRQVHYMRSQQLGADIDQTLVVKGASGGLTDSAYQDIFQAFKGDVLQVKGVSSIAASSNVMGQEIQWSTDWNRLSGADRHVFTLFMLGVDDDFIGTYGLKLVAGRSFSRAFVTDRKSVVLNESAVRELSFSSPQAAIGQLVQGRQPNMDSLHVIGVIADYHHEGLQKAIQPLARRIRRDHEPARRRPRILCRYQILDRTCARDLISMSTSARS